jgi:hypothetical protein
MRTSVRQMGGCFRALFIFWAACSMFAQDKDHRQDSLNRLELGTIIAVHTNEQIEVKRSDVSAAVVLAAPINRVYHGIIDEDVRAENGRLAIPKGSPVELMVKVTHDNDLLLDLESIVANGQRYAVRAEPNSVEARRDDRVTEIMGNVTSAQVQGQVVNVPVNSLVTFRLKKALDVGVVDQGSDRSGLHYHRQ